MLASQNLTVKTAKLHQLPTAQHSFLSSAVITFEPPAAPAQGRGFAAAQGPGVPPPCIGPSCFPAGPWKSPGKSTSVNVSIAKRKNQQAISRKLEKEITKINIE